MKHLHYVTKPVPVPAFYYNLSLTQKLSELVTLGSLLESLKGILVPAGS